MFLDVLGLNNSQIYSIFIIIQKNLIMQSPQQTDPKKALAQPTQNTTTQPTQNPTTQKPQTASTQKPTTSKTQVTQQQIAATKQRLQKIHKNHPDCIPILFMKHPQAPNSVKPPTTPFILFKKSFKIEQAMINLYKQIDQKGLYFFCPYLTTKDQLKYTMLKPGPTIEDTYKKYGRGGYLTIVYADKNLGMGGVMRMEKWVIRLLCIIVMFWIWIYGYSYYQAYQSKPDTAQRDIFQDDI